MPRYKLVVLSRPVKGREDEYHRWYQHVHLGQVVGFEGFKSAQRFRLVKNLVPRAADPFMAIYEIETDDLDGMLQEVQSHSGTERLTLSDALDEASAFTAIYEEFGAAVTKSQ